jgi:hypothetical protein
MTLSGPPPLRDDLAAVLDSARRLVHWIATRQDGLEVKAGNATRVPAVLLDLAAEHHVSIVHLVAGRMNGSAFALLRPEFEAFVRAVWLQLCATTAELEAFVEKDELPLTLGGMIEAVEGHPHFADNVLSGLKTSAWKAMCGYTHGGMLQVARRLKEDSIQPNYDPEEIIEVLKASGTFALMALLQIARLSRKSELEKEVAARLAGVE